MKLYVLGDLHYGSSTFNEAFFNHWLESFRKEKGAKKIILNGDLVDMLDSDRFYKPADVPTLNDSIEYVVDNLYPYRKHIIANLRGNHSCFSEDTEVLTIDGFKKGIELEEEDYIATMNLETEELEYQQAENIYINYFDGNMYHFTGRNVDLLITPNHRLIYKSYRSKEYNLDEARNIKIKEMVIPQSTINTQPDYPISDDWIKLTAWCLTDSHFDKKYDNITFYQRESTSYRIKELLERLNINFKTRIRNRNIKEICGKPLKNKPQPSYEFYLNVESARYVKKYCPSHTTIPDWIYKLSKKQFITFLEEIVFCDGSKHKSNPDSSWMVYKNKSFLEQLQILCIMNGIRASISEYRPGNYKLNCPIHLGTTRIQNKPIHTKYDGLIWCATVHNDSLIVRRNGKIAITGNSRAIKKFDLDISKLIGDQLGVKTGVAYHNDLSLGKNSIRLFVQHNAPVSKSTLLAMRRFMDSCNNIDADLYIAGHNHRSFFAPKVLRGLNYQPYRKYYCFNGCFLDYKGSYGEGKYDFLIASYPIISINKKTKQVNCEIIYSDQIEQ